MTDKVMYLFKTICIGLALGATGFGMGIQYFLNAPFMASMLLMWTAMGIMAIRFLSLPSLMKRETEGH